MFKFEVLTKVQIILGFMVCLCLQMNAQNRPVFETLEFHSEFEEESFVNYLSDSASLEAIVKLWLGTSPGVKEEDASRTIDKIHSILTVLGEQELGRKKVKKAIKDIYVQVHDAHFKIYKEEVNFHQIFDSGKYNCVTASGLYALVLDHFKIPYELIEAPDHVYIIVDPENEAILVESTTPEYGVYNLKIDRYIDFLRKQKVISEEEYKSKSAAELFTKYVNEGEKTISVNKIGGILYHNAAIFTSQNKTFTEARALIDKAMFLYPNEQTDDLRLGIIAYQVSEYSYENLESFNPYFDLIEYEEYRKEGLEEFKTQFYVIAQKYLVEEQKPEEYARFYRHCLARLSPHTDAVKLLGTPHHLFMARRHVLRHENELAFQHLDSAYQLSPKDLQIQSFLTPIILQKVSELDADPNEVEAMLSKYKSQYPFLEENTQFKEMELAVIGYYVDYYFEEENPEEALKRFEIFKAALEKFSMESDRIQEIVGLVYGSISGYYIRNSDYVKGKEWLEEGLKLAPKSHTLDRKMKAYEEFELLYKN